MINKRILLVSDNLTENNKKIAKSDEGYYKMGFLKYFIPILNSFEKKFGIDQIWVGSNGGKRTKIFNQDIDGYHIFNFKDANDLLENLKPDLIMLATSQEHISRSILIAAKSKMIPSVIVYSGLPRNDHNISIKKTIPIRINQILHYGRTFLKKYLFLIRTLYNIDYKIWNIIKMISSDLHQILTSFSYEFTEDYADLYICSNLDWKIKAVKNGIKDNKIVVVGEYAFDHMYKKFANLENNKKSEKNKILILTAALVEHGFWNSKMRKEFVEKLINSLKQAFGDTITIVFKIHPTAEKIEDYEKIITPIDKSIRIIKNQDLTELIVDSKLVITANQSSSLLEVLLLKKPLFIMNLFNENAEKNLYVNENVALECKNTDELISKIKSEAYKKIDSKKIQDFIERKIHKFDGKCGERAALNILQLLDEK